MRRGLLRHDHGRGTTLARRETAPRENLVDITRRLVRPKTGVNLDMPSRNRAVVGQFELLQSPAALDVGIADAGEHAIFLGMESYVVRSGDGGWQVVIVEPDGREEIKEVCPTEVEAKVRAAVLTYRAEQRDPRNQS